jgi:hypothetical protein
MLAAIPRLPYVAIRAGPLDAVPVGRLALGLFTVEEDNPNIEDTFARTKKPCRFEHHARSRASIGSTNEMRHAQSDVMGCIEDDARTASGNLER